MLVPLLVGAALLWIFYKKYTSVYQTWKKRGIAYIPGTFPFGSRKELPLFQEYPGYVFDEMYKQQAGLPYFGIYIVRDPVLIIRDPEMIKNVLTKEFSHFRDRLGFELPKDDPLANHLFNLEGERWRALRVKLSPTFTSGKLKGMYQHFIDCAEILDKFLMAKSEPVVDVKDITGRFNTDVICSCAFGIEVNSIDDSETGFRKIGKGLTAVSLRTKLRAGLTKLYPPLASFFQVKFGNQTAKDFMVSIVKDSIEYREKHQVKRNDFLELLIQLKNSKGTLIDDQAQEVTGKKSDSIDMTLELMTAQCFVFFVAGFETSSSVQSCSLYELALHPDIQERLRKEIEEVTAKHGGLTYQAVLDMEYLDMVISETMRKYPTLSQLNRRCTKSFVTPAGHRIEKGDSVIVPLWSLHHDPEYFPDPERFDPERFSPDNKDSIKPFTYLPFGEGPRICIGMRFGQLQTKLGLITVLRRFKIEPTDGTPIPLRHACHGLLTLPDRPIFLKLSSL